MNATTSNLFMEYAGLDLNAFYAMATSTFITQTGYIIHYFQVMFPYLIALSVLGAIIILANKGRKKII